MILWVFSYLSFYYRLMLLDIAHSNLIVAFRIRLASSDLLPLDNSFIPFDLLFKVGMSHFDCRELTLKSLFTGLPHSEMGMRYHLKRLISNGWIELLPSKNDKRSKLVIPTCKFLGQLVLLEQEFSKFLQQHTLNVYTNPS